MEENENLSTQEQETYSNQEPETFNNAEVTKLNGEAITPAEPKKNKSLAIALAICATLLVTVVIIIAVFTQIKDKADTSDILVEDASFSENVETEPEIMVIENPAVLPEHEGLMVDMDSVDMLILKMADYKGITVVASKEEITDDDVDYYSSLLFNDEAVGLEIGEAHDGDTVTINYVGTIDGVAFQGGTADGQQLTLGSHSYIAGFEEGLVGAVKGETRELNLKFPDSYGNADLAGKDCVFTVTVTAITPGLSDEAVAMLNNEAYTNVAEYKEYVRNELEDYYRADYEDAVVFGAIEQIVADSEFAGIPESIIAPERENAYSSYEETAMYYGMDVDTLLTYYGMDLDSVALNYARQKLIFYKIAKEEGLYPDDAALDAFFTDTIPVGDSYSSLDEYYAAVTKEYAVQQYVIFNVYDFLLANTVAIAE